MARSASGRSTGRRVARAASTGGGRSAPKNAPLGFYTLIALAFIVGTVLVIVSRNQKLNAASTTTTAAPGPVVGNHWHAALAFDVCGKIEPPLPKSRSATGLYSDGSGLIGIAPVSSATSGANATLGRLVSSIKGLVLTPTQLKLPGHSLHRDGMSCAGKPASVQVKVWPNLQDTTSTSVANPATLKLLNGQLITVAFLPSGAAVPKPPTSSITGLLKAMSATSKANGGVFGGSAPTTTSTVPSASSTTAAPTSTTAPAASTGSTSTTPAKSSTSSTSTTAANKVTSTTSPLATTTTAPAG
ncbi:MAG: hypothetical protein ACYDH5_11980 [Acidimicrobiales bacterium]